MFIIRFQELLRESNTTKSQVALKTNIPLQTICNWFERGSQPAADKIIKLADFFEVSTDYLLGRSNDIGIVEVQNELTKDQRELLNLYNQMSFQDKNQLLGFAKALVYWGKIWKTRAKKVMVEK